MEEKEEENKMKGNKTDENACFFSDKDLMEFGNNMPFFSSFIVFYNIFSAPNVLGFLTHANKDTNTIISSIITVKLYQ